MDSSNLRRWWKEKWLPFKVLIFDQGREYSLKASDDDRKKKNIHTTHWRQCSSKNDIIMQRDPSQHGQTHYREQETQTDLLQLKL